MCGGVKKGRRSFFEGKKSQNTMVIVKRKGNVYFKKEGEIIGLSHC